MVFTVSAAFFFGSTALRFHHHHLPVQAVKPAQNTRASRKGTARATETVMDRIVVLLGFQVSAG